MWDQLSKYTYKANGLLNMVIFTKLALLGHTPPCLDKDHPAAPFARLTGAAVGTIGLTSYLCSLKCLGCGKARTALKAGVCAFAWSLFYFTNTCAILQPGGPGKMVSYASPIMAAIMTLDVLKSVHDGFPGTKDEESGCNCKEIVVYR
eukprot:391715_1